MPLSAAAQALLRQQCFINGIWVSAQSGATFTVLNPANQSEIAQVPALSAKEINTTIDIAEQAGKTWRTTSATERSRLLRAWFQLVMAQQKALAEIITLEQGKPLTEAQGEIAYAASYIEWYAEEAKRNYGETIPGPNRHTNIIVQREPVGVCAAITPWNFPAAMMARKVAPALAAGCTIIIKPATETPLTTLAFAELAAQAGIPAGVINVVTGSAALIGEQLTANPKVRKLSFTGSTPVGALLMAQSSPSIKRLSLELGGNAPFIVFDDADIPAAVQGVIDSKFRNAGQTCVCANRIYVQRAVYEQFSAALVEQVAQLNVGNGFEPNIQLGPLINQAAVDKVKAHIADALAQGGELLLGGQPHALGGNWFEPTVLGKVPPTALCTKEETFGPVAPLIIFDGEDEVLQWANNTEFGLAAYFYSQSLTRVQRVAAALEAGMVGINTGLISNAHAPFGGIKQSGLGREGGYQGLEEYTELKYLCFGF